MLKKFNLKYKPYGENGILIEWPKIISKNILDNISLFVTKLELERPNFIQEFNYVYSSLLIIYNNKLINFQTIKTELESYYNSIKLLDIEAQPNCWEIPVCYDENFGIDLPEMCQTLNLTADKIIDLHSTGFYKVYGYGFLPGFLYLGGLPKAIHFPRKNIPRLHVFEGAVAIGGSQTGIYPQDSPGGWNIIGKTPIKLFDINNQKQLGIIQIGDLVKFKSVTISEFNFLSEQIKQRKYFLKNISYD